MSDSEVTASQLGLCACHGCGGLSQLIPGIHEMRCRRCGAALHLRKPNCISRTWALLIAAYIMYIPANLLPIMNTGSLFGSQSDTIMSGVVMTVIIVNSLTTSPVRLDDMLRYTCKTPLSESV